MENNKNKQEKLPDNLLSSDLSLARTVITQLRKEGKLEDIPRIINALRLHETVQIRKELKDLLCDIQLEGAQPFIIKALKDPKNEEIHGELLSVCWESKHNYSEYLDVFISSFLNGDYRASLEAFTVIEKIFMDYEYDEAVLIKTINLIKTSYSDLTENKRDLALVLIDSLDGLKED